jgi:AcrR family transcriptional regulator
MTTTSTPKRTQIIATGKELFWKFGFKRVTIEEIAREARVSKMTFYKYFPNKTELAIVVLDELFETNLEKVRKLTDEHIEPAETLRKILQLKSEGTRNISEEFIKDLYSYPEGELKAYMEKKMQIMLAEIIKVYEKGKEDGWVRKDLNIPFLMLFTRKLIDLFSDDAMLHYFDTSQDLVMEITNLIVYGISPHE